MFTALYAVCFILLYSFPMLLTFLIGRARRIVSLFPLLICPWLMNSYMVLTRSFA